MSLGLDFETFSEVDLKVHGADNYFTHPSTRVLCAATAQVSAQGHITASTRDFVTGSPAEREYERGEFIRRTRGQLFVAHNAGFEYNVFKHLLNEPVPLTYFVDSAVIARAVGAGSKLEAAAPQLLGVDKLDDGIRLIKKFSMPQADGFVYVDHVDDWTPEDHEDWRLFLNYCQLDAILSARIEHEYDWILSPREHTYWQITELMNQTGWRVDLDLVKRMQDQYRINVAKSERWFRNVHDPDEKLNFRSTPQLRAWCKERGVLSKSFDEQHVAKLISKVSNRIQTLRPTKPDDPRIEQLDEVLDMLLTKQTLGGSSLSKLQTILDTTGSDGRLRNQYLHIGAGQTWRTSGRGVQMQNLKRLGPEPDDVTEDLDEWSNTKLARNLRQVFTAEHPDGELLVGDFASVESRGLAYLAGAEWKLKAYRLNRDMYKVLASEMFHTPYEDVTKQERQAGKVGELSCGYGAGPGAVSRFAEKMGIEMSEDEAKSLVYDWRDTNPEIVKFWRLLDDALHEVVEHQRTAITRHLGHDLELRIAQIDTPFSLRKQSHARAPRTIVVELFHRGTLLVRRVFQGCFMDGNDICYHKASELKGGKLWLDKWTKDGQSGRWKIYGGKLAGILTQSFCREIFFNSLRLLTQVLDNIPNAKIVGQFHDEIVVEWWPGYMSMDRVIVEMEYAMTSTPLDGFPLAAKIEHDYRYLK